MTVRNDMCSLKRFIHRKRQYHIQKKKMSLRLLTMKIRSRTLWCKKMHCKSNELANVFLKKCCGGLCLWKRILDLGSSASFGHFRVDDFFVLFITILSTLESGINVPIRLLIFGIFSRGYGLITDLKDLNFTT